MSTIAKELARENFLLTRHLREHLTLILSLISDEWKPTVVVEWGPALYWVQTSPAHCC